MSIVYRAYCPQSGKFYVGQTRHDSWVACYRTRWEQAEKRKAKGCRLNRWERALLKYGKTGFQFRNLVTGLSPAEADKLEIFFIKHYRSTDVSFGYNTEVGGNKNKGMAESTRKALSDLAPKARWYHKAHGIVEENLHEVARIAGLSPGSFCRLKQGKLRAHRGWVSLDAPAYERSLGRPYVWQHPLHGVFIGTAKEVELRFLREVSKSKRDRGSLTRVRSGQLPHHKQWYFIRVPTLAEEIQARIDWANSPHSDSDLRIGKRTR
jgi:hypothetical protein